MGVRVVGDKVEHTFNVPNTELFDIFAVFAEVFFNSLDFVPTVHAYGRQDETCYIVHDHIRGMNVPAFLWQNKDVTNVFETFNTLAYKWPYMCYNASKQFINVSNHVLTYKNSFLKRATIDANGKIWLTDLTSFEIESTEKGGSSLLSPDFNTSLFSGWLGAAVYKNYASSDSFVWSTDVVKLKNQIRKLESELNVKQWEIDRLELKSKKDKKAKMNVETVKANLGEDVFRMYFGDLGDSE